MLLTSKPSLPNSSLWLLETICAGLAGALILLSLYGCHLLFPYNQTTIPAGAASLCSAQIYRALAGSSEEFTEEWRLYTYGEASPFNDCSSKLSQYINTSMAPGFSWNSRNLAVTAVTKANGSNCSEASVVPLLSGAPLGAELNWQNPPSTQAYAYIQLVDKNGATHTAEPAVLKASVIVAEKTGLPDWSAGGTYVRGKQHARFLDFYLELATPFTLGSGKTVTKLYIQSSGTVIAEKDSPGTLYKIYPGRATFFFNAEGQIDGNSGSTSFCHKNQANGSFTLYQGLPYAFFTMALTLTPEVIGQNMLVTISLSKPTASPSSLTKHQPFVGLANKTVKGPLVSLAPDTLHDHDGDLLKIYWFENFEAASERFLGVGNPLHVLFTPGSHEVTAVAYDSRGTYNSAVMTLTVTDQHYQAGPETQINPSASPDYDRRLPAITFNSIQNEYLVAWHTSDPSTYSEIRARRISNLGALQTSFIISSGYGNRVQPAAAYSAVDQQYLVVWMLDVSASGHDASKYDLWGRFVSWNGTSMSPEFRIYTWYNRSFWSPRVAWNSYRNQYLVVWNALDTLSSLFSDVAGLRIGNGAIVSGSTTLFAVGQIPHQADVTYNLAADEYYLVWREQYSGGDWDIRGVRLRGDNLAQVSSPIRVGGSLQDEQSPSIACNQQGSYLAAWQQTAPGPCCDWNIYAQELNNLGEKTGNLLVLSDSPEDESWPRAVARPGVQKDFAVVWQRPSATGIGIYASRWGGVNFGGIHQYAIADYAFWNNEKPVIAAGRPGFYIAYEGISAGDPHAHRSIYGLWWGLVGYLPLLIK